MSAKKIDFNNHTLTQRPHLIIPPLHQINSTRQSKIQNIDLGIKEWSDKIKLKKLEKTLDWKIARVTKIGISNFEIITSDGDIGFITNENIKWTRKTNTSFKEGDIIYVKKKEGSNEYILKQLPTANGAIVVMDPYNGRVLALSGGFSFNQSEFNRATQAQRQPGSAFKPFVYAAALENGYTPSTLVLDAPLVLEQGTDLKMWKPENYGKKFYGSSTLRTGVE